MSDTTTAWYLKCSADAVADRAIVVGDRGRVRLAAEHLDDVQWLNEDRGLTTVTGTRNGTPVTVSAFGMGAPIAAIVVDELTQLGVHSIIRLGTAMTHDPVVLGDFVVAEAAVREESTSATYAPPGYPAAADVDLTAALDRRARQTGRRTHRGLLTSYDGFYTQMLPNGDRPAAPPLPGVLGIDMETATVLTVARVRGARAGSLCLASVRGDTAEAMDADPRHQAEHDLLRAGLDVLADLTPPA